MSKARRTQSLVLGAVASFVIGLAIGLSIAGGRGRSAGEIDFSVIKQGQMLVRAESDRMYSAVIHDQVGLNEFLEDYPLDLRPEQGFFDADLLVVGFSDSCWAVTADGLKHRSWKDSPALYLDLHDKGVKVKAAKPPDGKKYSAWCAISISKDIAISHVQIREGISGNCRQFKDRRKPREETE